jgi:hypothetical protein
MVGMGVTGCGAINAGVGTRCGAIVMGGVDWVGGGAKL